eukprot:4980220-Amphidinium_carterae.1
MPAREGLGEPAQQDDVRAADPPAELPPTQDGEHEAAQASDRAATPTAPPALPTDTLSEYHDAEE